MKAVLVDDEEMVRFHLKDLLIAQGVQVVGEASNGLELLNVIRSEKPDLVFLDIQIPSLSGLQAAEVLNRTHSPPLLIFVTGFSEHAAKAFEVAAFDYLVKPVEAGRLAMTLTRAARHLAHTSPEFRSSLTPEPTTAANRLLVRTNYSMKLVRVEEIEYAVAREKKVFLRIGDGEHKTAYSLIQLEDLLPRREFLRIHSSCIVRQTSIDRLNFLGNHSYSVTTAGGVVLPVGRTYYPKLLKSLGIESENEP